MGAPPGPYRFSGTVQQQRWWRQVAVDQQGLDNVIGSRLITSTLLKIDLANSNILYPWDLQ